MEIKFGNYILFKKYVAYIRYPNDYRKIEYCESCDFIRGIVVGSVTRYEGEYNRGWSDPFSGEGEQGELTNRKSFRFYRVFTKMNKEYLVPIREARRFNKNI